MTWFLSKPSSLISRRFDTKRYLHGTSNPFPRFLPMNSHDDRPPWNAKLPWTACVIVPIVYTHLTDFVHMCMCYLNISLEEACVAISSHACNNTSRSTQNMKARCFNYYTVVLISGNENQKKYSWYKTWKTTGSEHNSLGRKEKKNTMKWTMRLDGATLST